MDVRTSHSGLNVALPRIARFSPKLELPVMLHRMTWAARTVALIAILLLTACGSAMSRQADGAAPPGDEVDYTCNVAADCVVKDIGGCCGYTPACVNRDSPTFPEQVAAECRKQGRVGICGFPVITGCTCEQHRCTPIHGSPSSGPNTGAPPAKASQDESVRQQGSPDSMFPARLR